VPEIAMDGFLLDIPHLDPFQKWAIICAGVLTLVYAVMRPMRKRKDPLVRQSSPSLAAQRETEKQMTELLVELEQMARKMTAQLDTRTTKLELLIREADQKIALLRIANGGAVHHLPADDPIPEPGMPDPRHADVYDLANQGQSARQIAQKLGRPYGEIELILALRGHARPQTTIAEV